MEKDKSPYAMYATMQKSGDVSAGTRLHCQIKIREKLGLPSAFGKPKIQEHKDLTFYLKWDALQEDNKNETTAMLLVNAAKSDNLLYPVDMEQIDQLLNNRVPAIAAIAMGITDLLYGLSLEEMQSTTPNLFRIVKALWQPQVDAFIELHSKDKEAKATAQAHDLRIALYKAGILTQQMSASFKAVIDKAPTSSEVILLSIIENRDPYELFSTPGKHELMKLLRDKYTAKFDNIKSAYVDIVREQIKSSPAERERRKKS